MAILKGNNMTKHALPKTDPDSVLICIGFIFLVILVIMLAVHKLTVSLASLTKETLYERPTWTEANLD